MPATRRFVTLMATGFIGIFVWMIVVASPSQTAAQNTEQHEVLETGFTQPPHAARPSIYWLWLNGYVNRDHFRQELNEFANAGIGGLCIFDMGARGDARFTPPAGPEFMGDEFVESVGRALAIAQRLGMDVQLATSSSWDLGGAWVTPEHASKALYRSELRVKGPQQLETKLPMPPLPAAIPKRPDGKPAFQAEVALLAIPETKRMPAHEFIFSLPGVEPHKIDHVVVYNTAHNPSKDFSVALSLSQPLDSDFHDVVHDELVPTTGPQRFDFAATDARFVRLRIFTGHNSESDGVQLGEFEVYSTDAENVVAAHEVDRTRDAAEIVWYSSEAANGSRWTAANLNDGATSGATGVWAYTGPPPLVIEDPSQIIDLTDQVGPAGELKWEVPPGRWTLMRFVCASTGERLKVPSPKSDGLATDHFSAEATRLYLQTLVDRLQSRLGDLPAAGITQLYLPSYEVRGQLWTPDMLTLFKNYRRYDMTNYLPALAGCKIESDDRTQRFLYDFQKTMGDLLVDAYYRTASETAHRAGLGIEAEAGGPGPPIHQVPVDALKALGAIDEMRGEFWPWRPEQNQLWVVKETACAAHVYGRRRVHMEAFTGFRHWQDGPSDLKPWADRAFCEGMNHVVWHTSSHQPPEAGKPGWVYGAGTHLTPNLVWWPMGKPFIDYLSRCSFMLQRGLFVADVCFYYGDQGANFVPPKHVDPSLGNGYDYDVANPEVVLHRMSVRDGRISLPHGMQYELLVLPNRQDCDLEVLQKLEQLVKAGATVVGPKPVQSNGLTGFPGRDQQVKQLADKLWGDCDGKTVTEHVDGAGRIIWGRSLREILNERGIGPDFQFVSENRDCQIDFIHRRSASEDIYFVRNMSGRPESITAEFRVSDRRPELFLPDSGLTIEVAVYRQKQGRTQVPLQLAPYASVFVVFRKPAEALHLTSTPNTLDTELLTSAVAKVTAYDNGRFLLRTSDNRDITVAISDLSPAQQVTGPWHVTFPSGWGAPPSITLDKLASWTELEPQAVRHFSGMATYQKTVNIPDSWLGKQRRVYLYLGNLWAVGRVRLNGKPLGILWKPPYRLDITEAARSGANQLEVDVANTWANRLVAEANLSEQERITKTNVTRSGTPGRPWKQISLRESGLFGPVTMVPATQRLVSIARVHN